MRIKSPVTNSDNIVFEEELDIELVINKYKNDYQIDINNYFKNVSFLRIYKCLDTEYRFYFPFDIVGHSDLYKKLQNQSWYYTLRWEHKIAEKFFQSNSSVLEIGCGKGDFLKKLQQKNKNIFCTGLEFNENAANLAKIQGINVLKQDICEHARDHIESYDVVCYFQVLEHIPQVQAFIQASIETLKTGGQLIIGVPNNNPFLYRYDKYHTLNLPPHHMGLWNLKSMKNLQKVFSLRLDKIFIEPLNQYEYNYYFQVISENLNQESSLLNKAVVFLFSSLKNSQMKWLIQSLVCQFIQGRNILAVYTKI
ncbi:class I SAM-dependent methyltransferase [Nostoc sp.]|uniref:class I SAM-dependent methyltransferase n=1 Tax=Nostoc sp. TaxID=1180 RepID=UPI002FF7C5EE